MRWGIAGGNLFFLPLLREDETILLLMAKRFFGVPSSQLLPLGIGAAGVIYYAMQAHTPKQPSAKELREWEKHLQTGQLVAVAALSAGLLISRARGRLRK